MDRYDWQLTYRICLALTVYFLFLTMLSLIAGNIYLTIIYMTVTVTTFIIYLAAWTRFVDSASWKDRYRRW